MNPTDCRLAQIKRYKAMSGEQRLLIGLRLHELSCDVARDSIKARFPDANNDVVEEKLRQRLRLAYSRSDSEATG